jgi:hypothetical protein
MRFDTEDLLTIRDGEPIDARRKASVLADADEAREVARLERVKRALQDLPELPPPPGVWNRIAAQLDVPAPPRRTARRVAAAVFLSAVLFATASTVLWRGRDASPAQRGAAMPDSRTGGPSASDITAQQHAPPGGASASRAYDPLVTESARLERVLAGLRSRPEIMTVGTAGTIASLEDTLAALDEQLTFAAAGGLDPGERETLWRERVNVMNALVQVRYAQAQSTAF